MYLFQHVVHFFRGFHALQTFSREYVCVGVEEQMITGILRDVDTRTYAGNLHTLLLGLLHVRILRNSADYGSLLFSGYLRIMCTNFTHRDYMQFLKM